MDFNFNNYICIPESLNTHISHHLFDYIITFVNLRTRTQIQKVILYSKPVLNVCFKDFWDIKINQSQKYIFSLSIFSTLNLDLVWLNLTYLGLNFFLCIRFSLKLTFQTGFWLIFRIFRCMLFWIHKSY